MPADRPAVREPRVARQWVVADAEPDAAAALARQLGTAPLVGQLLLNRGQRAVADARRFLTPRLADLHDPAALPGCADAAERVARAVRDDEPIVVYGDYDVDGITASAILWHALRRLGATRVEAYVPHRLDEGYGLNAEAVELICKGGARLIVTVDCGVTAGDAIRAARAHGVDVVVTDHHDWADDCAADAPDQIREKLGACALVHPRLGGYPNPHLCGAGVAFKLAWAVGQKFGVGGKVPDALRDFLVEATALAGLGTIADVVPLVGENRTLARFGLGGVEKTNLVGLRALIDSAQLAGKKLDSFDVGFKLGPRLNACGRMGHALLAVEMLTTATAARAREIADYLEEQNRERQAVERKIADEAMAQAEAHNGAAVVVAGDWHPGVVGIVASRLVDRLHKPAVVLGRAADGSWKGSGRSVAGFHLARALACCAEYLSKHGGHEMAAGLALGDTQLEPFRAAFAAEAERALPDGPRPTLRVDVACAFSDLSDAVVRDVDKLGPFGAGNPRPALLFENVTLTNAPKAMGATQKHLSLYLRQGAAYLRAVAFNAADRAGELKAGAAHDFVAEAKLNAWNGRVSVELEVRDFRTARV